MPVNPYTGIEIPAPYDPNNPGSHGSSAGAGAGGTEEDHEIERQRRLYAQQQTGVIEHNLATQNGSVADILGRMGIHDVQGEGRARYQEYVNFLTQYGLGTTPNNQYDWQGGMKYDPLYGTEGVDADGKPTYERGKWVPINSDEWKSYNEAQGLNDKYGEGNFNPWRIAAMKQQMLPNAGGDLHKDEQGRWYHDTGTVREYYDDRYQLIGTGPSLGNGGSPGSTPKPGKNHTGPSFGGGPTLAPPSSEADRLAKEAADKAVNDAALKAGPPTVPNPASVPSATASPRPVPMPQTEPWGGTGVVNSSAPSQRTGVAALTPSSNASTPMQRDVTNQNQKQNLFNPAAPKKQGQARPNMRVPGFSL